MGSSTAAAPAEKSHYINSGIKEEVRKFAGQKLSTPGLQTEVGNRQSQIVDDPPGSQGGNNIERIRSSVERLSSRSVDGLERLSFELQELQKLLKSEVERVQGEIGNALAGIKIITEVIAPWKKNTSVSQPPSADAGDVPADPATTLNSEPVQSSG